MTFDFSPRILTSICSKYHQLASKFLHYRNPSNLHSICRLFNYILKLHLIRRHNLPTLVSCMLPLLLVKQLSVKCRYHSSIMVLVDSCLLLNLSSNRALQLVHHYKHLSMSTYNPSLCLLGQINRRFRLLSSSKCFSPFISPLLS